VWTNAKAIASTYPLNVRDHYTSAASTLRIPYWDWAAHPSLPDATSHPTVRINTPNGIATVTNPLYAYTFLATLQAEGVPGAVPMANMTHTVRHWDWKSKQSNQTAANAYLMAQAPTILSLTYQLFTIVKDYTSFSCTSPGGGAYTGNNIENIHNNIHDSVGGIGHMTFIEVAAFDPLFYLHHANVDRVFAMWQALNPDSYIQPTINTYGTYYEVAGFVDSGNTSIAPRMFLMTKIY
jgi:tyrosinase